MDPAEDDRLRLVAPLQARGVDPDRHVGTGALELVGRLLEELLDMRHDEDPAAPELHGIVADRGEQRSLSPARRDDD
jgi:hypothetical protein